jgi:anti-sigma regulatory factor (Ser/Thr protein kinase)
MTLLPIALCNAWNTTKFVSNRSGAVMGRGLRYEANLGRGGAVPVAMTPAAVVLGSVTVPGMPEHVSRTRAFVADLANRAALGPDMMETASLLTSELVTNAMLHTSSGGSQGTVTVVVIDGPGGLMVEVIDDGSPDRGPEVQGDRYAAQGHGLFLVEQLASRWGFLRDGAGTTVWFELDGPGFDD